MWWAGVAWQSGNFEVAVLDEADHQVAPAVRFTGRQTPRLIQHLAQYAERCGDLRIIIDSTNGVLDGHLLAAGLSVYRVDPPALPSRPEFGSVSASILASCGVTRPAALTGLSLRVGSLAGRRREYVAKIAISAREKRRLQRSGQLFTRGSKIGRAIGLTFDDGPHPDFTPQVLEILRRYSARATFFCLGINARAFPELVARSVEEGHQVGNHTWSHPFLPDLDRDEVLRQVDATNDALAQSAGGENRLVRPPYGAWSPRVLRWLGEHGMVTAVWDVDSRDWAAPGVEVLTDRVVSRVRPGSVVLMHDAGGDRRQTVAALPGIVEKLINDGYQLVTVDEVISPHSHS